MKNDRREFVKNTILAITGGVIIAGTSAFAIGGMGMGMGRGMGGGGMMLPATNIPMTVKQKNELLYLYQEEKVARDVYVALGKLYPNEMTFANIPKSEQQHMDRMAMLCSRYGTDISKINEDQYGKFVLPELQKLYDTLVQKGKKSRSEALKVGELIEVTDIADIDKMLLNFKEYPDVTMVLERLRQGSENHLAAFRRWM